MSLFTPVLLYKGLISISISKLLFNLKELFSGRKKKKIFLELIWKKKGILEAAPVNFNLSEKRGFSQVDSMRRAEGSGRPVPRLVPVRTAWLVEMIIKLNLIPVRTRGRRRATAILMF